MLAIILLCIFVGCVERTVTINTEPKGAIVWLNDKEVGRTPVTVPFKWYGDYDVIIRKEGYETLKTHRKLVRPWYEYIPFDLFAEVFTPAVIHDDHFWEFELEQGQPVAEKELLERAMEFRNAEQEQGLDNKKSRENRKGKENTESNRRQDNENNKK